MTKNQKPIVKILMVCLGNICRSPLAEGILQSKVNSDLVFVDSAGTSGWHVGELPDQRSILIAEQNGIDLTNQQSRKFTTNDFDRFDLIYAMDTSNYNDILSLSRNKTDKSKVHFILRNKKNVPDPYYGGDNGFKNVFDMLNEACDYIVNEVL